MKKLFAKKALRDLVEESNHHHFKRVLGPFSLTALGIGAVIGAGIFVLTGLAAKEYAGPSLILSFVLSGLACIFVALCYAEFASMVPLAGSAYTYSYAALGEVFAWIIGWDLILEYSLASSLVAVGWSHYFVKLIGLFGLHIPPWLTNDYWTLSHQLNDTFAQSVPHLSGIPIVFNLPAGLIIVVITALLVIGIKESARFNSIIVGVKLAVILLVIFMGWFYVKNDNWGNSWTSFAPFGIGRHRNRRSVRFLCLYRFRCSLNNGTGGKKSKEGCAYRHHCLSGSMYYFIHCCNRSPYRHDLLQGH